MLLIVVLCLVHVPQYPSASYDFINYNSDPTPDPPLSSDDAPNSHGTSCAGEIAMTRDSKCGSGVAFNSKFAGRLIINDPVYGGHMNTVLFLTRNAQVSRSIL